MKNEIKRREGETCVDWSSHGSLSLHCAYVSNIKRRTLINSNVLIKRINRATLIARFEPSDRAEPTARRWWRRRRKRSNTLWNVSSMTVLPFNLCKFQLIPPKRLAFRIELQLAERAYVIFGLERSAESREKEWCRSHQTSDMSSSWRRTADWVLRGMQQVTFERVCSRFHLFFFHFLYLRTKPSRKRNRKRKDGRKRKRDTYRFESIVQ